MNREGRFLLRPVGVIISSRDLPTYFELLLYNRKDEQTGLLNKSKTFFLRDAISHNSLLSIFFFVPLGINQLDTKTSSLYPFSCYNIAIPTNIIFSQLPLFAHSCPGSLNLQLLRAVTCQVSPSSPPLSCSPNY